MKCDIPIYSHVQNPGNISNFWKCTYLADSKNLLTHLTTAKWPVVVQFYLENLDWRLTVPFLFPVSPQILLSPIHQSVIDGDSVNFTCRAMGVPTPDVTWTFNDHKLPSGTKENKFQGDYFVELFLEIQKITKKMEGIYKCTAKSKTYTTSSSTTLHIFGR